MANPIPPPAQRFINYLRNVSPTNQTKILRITTLALCIIILLAFIITGLGLAGKIPQKLDAPIIGFFSFFICFLGTVVVVLRICDYLFSQPIPQPLPLPMLIHTPSTDSGLGSASSSLALSLDRSRENLQGSHDSSLNSI